MLNREVGCRSRRGSEIPSKASRGPRNRCIQAEVPAKRGLHTGAYYQTHGCGRRTRYVGTSAGVTAAFQVPASCLFQVVFLAVYDGTASAELNRQSDRRK